MKSLIRPLMVVIVLATTVFAGFGASAAHIPDAQETSVEISQTCFASFSNAFRVTGAHALDGDADGIACEGRSAPYTSRPIVQDEAVANLCHQAIWFNELRCAVGEVQHSTPPNTGAAALNTCAQNVALYGQPYGCDHGAGR